MLFVSAKMKQSGFRFLWIIMRTTLMEISKEGNIRGLPKERKQIGCIFHALLKEFMFFIFFFFSSSRRIASEWFLMPLQGQRSQSECSVIFMWSYSVQSGRIPALTFLCSEKYWMWGRAQNAVELQCFS